MLKRPDLADTTDYYDGIELCQQGLGFVVNKRVVVETKATEQRPRAAPRQTISYLRATNLEVGFLLHFGPEAKFCRLYAPNNLKRHQPNSINPTDPQRASS